MERGAQDKRGREGGGGRQTVRLERGAKRPRKKTGNPRKKEQETDAPRAGRSIPVLRGQEKNKKSKETTEK